MDFKFSAPFQELDKRKTFLNVLYSVSGVKEKIKIRLDMIGPFLLFSDINSNPLFMIFTEHYQAGKISNSSMPTVTVRSSYEDHIYYLYFKTPEIVNDFLINYYTIVTIANSFFNKVQCDQIVMTGELLGYFSNHNSILKSNCVLLRKSNSSYFFQAHGFDKNNILECLFDFHFDKFTFVTPLLTAPTFFSQKNIPTINYFMLCDIHNQLFCIFQCNSLSQCIEWILSIHSWFKISLRNQSSSPLKMSSISIPKTSNIKATFTDNRASINSTNLNDQTPSELNEKQIPIQNSESDNFFKDIVISSEDTNIPSPSSSRSYSSDKNHELDPLYIISTAMSPPNSPHSPPFSRFSNFPSSPRSSDAPSFGNIGSTPSVDSLSTGQQASVSNTSANDPNNHRTPSLSGRPIRLASPANKLRDNSRKEQQISSQSSARSESFIRNNPQILENEKKLKKQLEEARRLASLTPKNEFQFPSDTKQIVSSQLFSEEKYVKNQINLALSLFMSSDNYINSQNQRDDNSDDGTSETNDDSIFDKEKYDISYSEDFSSLSQINYSFYFNQFEPCDLRSTDEIIEGLFIGLKEHKKLNEIIKENLQEKYFPNFDFKKLYEADRPFVSILNDIASTTQEIQTQFIENNIEPSTLDRLCFLIAALFINGFKGFVSFRSKIDFLKPFREISSHVDGLFQVCDSVDNKADQNNLLSSQLSLFIIEILNQQLLLPILRSILEIDDWTKKYYNNSSYMCDDETIENICLILEKSISKLSFEIQVKNSIIANASNEDKKSYIFTPAFSYLDFSEISFQDNIATIKNNVCNYFVNLLNEGIIKKNPLVFLVEIAESDHVKNNYEFISFSSYVKKLPRGGDEQSKLQRITKHALRLNVLHIWFAFMFTNPSIASNYYRPDSIFCDLYRAKLVFSFILKYQSCFNSRL